jgi:spermidine/putrescine transport system permease protein
MNKNMRFAGLPYIAWMLIFICLPIALLGIYSFTDSAGNFSLQNFIDFFSPIYIKILLNSLYLAFISTLICFLLGYPVAYIISRVRSEKKRSTLLLLFILPMWMNFLLRTYSWMTLLGNNGIINILLSKLSLPHLNLLYNSGAVLLGMVYNFLPFMIYPIYSILIKIDADYTKAAFDLGANNAQAFFKITFPLSIPGVITGFTMVFMPAVSTFVIPSLLGGGQNMLIGNLIEQQLMQAGNWNFGSAASLIMMTIILITMQIMNKFDKTQNKNMELMA